MELERKINNVEEIPVGMKTKFILEEYPPGNFLLKLLFLTL